MLFGKPAFQNQGIPGLGDFSSEAALGLRVRQVDIPCKLLGDGGGPSDIASSKKAFLDGTQHANHVKAMVMPEGFVLGSNDSVNEIVRDIIVGYVDAVAVLLIDMIDDLSVVGIENGTLREGLVNVVRVDFRRLGSNGQSVKHKKDQQRREGEQHGKSRFLHSRRQGMGPSSGYVAFLSCSHDHP